ncbi:sensor histidine kinase [Bradyrhizobium sp. GCM10023182]|uniref:sensor histidine kinase n=1 Tax=Bradyrhizobium TaxID=374 RepID=UPI0030B81B80
MEQQAATSEVLEAINRSGFDLGQVMQIVVSTAARLCKVGPAGIFLLQDGVYRYWAGQHVTEAYREHEKRAAIRAGRGTIVGRAAMEKRAVQILDALEDPEYEDKEAARVENLRSMLGVPLLRDERLIGIFALARNYVEPFSDSQIKLVSTFANQAVIAIDSARLFEQVQTRTRELAQSLDNLRAAQDRLVQTEKLASLGQLTAGIAHEIKNPLNFVNNFAALSAELTDELKDVLRPAALDAALRVEVDELAGLLKENLSKVVQHGKRADSIVRNMLLHSREGSGEIRSADINALVDESLNLAYHGARAENPAFNVTLHRDFDPQAGEADVFPQEIIRVLLNLISNGFHAVTKRKAENGYVQFEPWVAASTRGRDDCVEIRIRDNGTGIPAAVKEKMFTPFFTTKPAGQGTGLGLSISHDIVVKQHGGAIEVLSEPGVFTEFIVILSRKARGKILER